MSPSQPMRRSPDAFDSPLVDKRDIGAELDNIFRLSAAAPTREPIERLRPRPPAPEARRVTQVDLDAALDMLSRAAQAMDVLQARYNQVESYARDIAQRAERDLGLVYEQKKDWEARALASEARFDEAHTLVENAKRQADTALQRAEQAEHRSDLNERLTVQAERRAEEAEKGAAEAREWLECFHDKIVASFDTRPFVKSAAA